ncbi:MAG: hypothetical protein GX774_16615 [Armatimonadetes bacterium]|nr:hypothetical protein [Armatimonadota bacterium]
MRANNVNTSGAAEQGKTEARPIAAMAAIAMAAACLLFGYEFIRTASTVLFQDAYGTKHLPLMMALMPPAVLLALYGYGFLLSRFGPARALLFTSGAAAALLIACYFAIVAGLAPATGVLYIVREAYIVVVLEQYWSLINSTLTHARAKRLNGPITGIASLGSILGADILSRYAEPWGTECFVLLTAASLVPAGIFSWLAYRLAGEPVPAPEEAGGRQGHLALRLFRQSRYLVWLAVLIALTQVMSTMLELRFYGLAEEAYPAKDARAAYLGGFWRNLNILAGGLQFVGAPLLLHALPLRVTHALIPLIHLGTCLALLLHPTLGTGALAYMTFKGLDYSLFRAGKEILYIPLSFDMRYRAKEVIDAFVYRFSKGVMGGLTEGAGLLLALPGQAYPAVAMVAAVVWLPLVLRLTKQSPSGKQA